MRAVDMREAKTHPSRLVEAAADGEPFIIARAGKPMVKVVALDAPEAGATRRAGFLAGRVSAPDDFDGMGGRRAGVPVRRRRASLLLDTHILLRAPGAEDPFDRILAAQARSEGVTLLTADEVVGRCPGPIRVLTRGGRGIGARSGR